MVTKSNGAKLYSGSCHCGAVRYQAELDLSGGISRCNCTICQKLGAAGAVTKPSAFRLLAGEAGQREYRVGQSPNSRFFCSHCGVQVYGKGHVEELGGDFVSVNANTLDGVELGELPIRYWDGRHDNWQAGTRDRPWPMLS